MNIMHSDLVRSFVYKSSDLLTEISLKIYVSPNYLFIYVKNVKC